MIMWWRGLSITSGGGCVIRDTRARWKAYAAMYGRACARMCLGALVRPHMYSEALVRVYLWRHARVCIRLCGNDSNSGDDGGARGSGRWQERCAEVWWRRVSMVMVVARVSRVGRSQRSAWVQPRVRFLGVVLRVPCRALDDLMARLLVHLGPVRLHVLREWPMGVERAGLAVHNEVNLLRCHVFVVPVSVAVETCPPMAPVRGRRLHISARRCLPRHQAEAAVVRDHPYRRLAHEGPVHLAALDALGAYIGRRRCNG